LYRAVRAEMCPLPSAISCSEPRAARNPGPPSTYSALCEYPGRRGSQSHAQGTPTEIVPSGAVELRSVPSNLHQAQFIHRARKELPSVQCCMPLAELDHAFPEAVQIAVPFYQRPIKPTDFVVLAVGVVVALLCTSYLVSSNEHRDATREQ